MQSGDFIAIDYIGKVKVSGEVFDVTMEEAAKKEKVYNPKVSYRPVNVVVGGGFVIKGLDDALKEMKIGNKRTVSIAEKDGFGERSMNMVRPIPLSHFKDQKIDPTPGSYININGVRGKILSSDGGRIKVDFNHPLAGKELEYEIEVKKEITEVVDKVKAVVGFLTGLDDEKIDAKVNVKEADVSFKTDQEVNSQMKKKIAELVVKWVKDIEKVRFVEEYDGKVEEKKD